jgi:hypothetical protein
MADRFWEKVERSDGCWMWTGGKSGGYGRFFIGYGFSFYHSRQAHRMAWELTYGPAPTHLWALHRCDVQLCVNPEHLFLGTAKDNTHDCLAKGRLNTARGERSGNAKLTEEIVRMIRSSTERHPVIARRLGLATWTVNNIRRGNSWKHVKD